MSASAALDRGRAAYDERRWRIAYDELTAADRENGGLSADDIERLAMTAQLIGNADSSQIPT